MYYFKVEWLRLGLPINTIGNVISYFIAMPDGDAPPKFWSSSEKGLDLPKIKVEHRSLTALVDPAELYSCYFAGPTNYFWRGGCVYNERGCACNSSLDVGMSEIIGTKRSSQHYRLYIGSE